MNQTENASGVLLMSSCCNQEKPVKGQKDSLFLTLSLSWVPRAHSAIVHSFIHSFTEQIFSEGLVSTERSSRSTGYRAMDKANTNPCFHGVYRVTRNRSQLHGKLEAQGWLTQWL